MKFKMSSRHWMEEIEDFVEIIDPDGWKRDRLFYTRWKNEKITKETFIKRLMYSTIQIRDRKRFEEWEKIK